MNEDSFERDNTDAYLLLVLGALIIWALASSPAAPQSHATYEQDMRPAPAIYDHSFNDDSTNVCVGYCPEGSR